MSWKFVKFYEHDPNGIWVEIIAHIMNNESREVRKYTTLEVLLNGEEHPNVFNWKENNYSCDCNRFLFFEYASGKTSKDIIEDPNCSNGKFSVNLQNPIDEKFYYQEFKESSNS